MVQMLRAYVRFVCRYVQSALNQPNVLKFQLASGTISMAVVI
jgi:hypothetical protein